MAAEVAAAAALGADLAELRLDRLAGFAPRRDLPALLAKPRTLPTLVTYRPKWEGGEYEGDDEPRFEALQLAMELGAEYVDIELKVADKFIKFMSGKKPENCKLIVSSHNYDNTPSAEELASLLAQIQATGADIVKIAPLLLKLLMFQECFKYLYTAKKSRSVGLHAVYVPFLVDDLAKFLSTYSSPDFAGFSCTIPHKEAAVRCCDEVDPIARDIGAVNTIIRKPDGKLVGYNTDYVGAISAIEDGIRENYHPEEGMILANTTAIGMHPNVNETPLSKQALKSYAVVFGVYTPKETRLLREAAECGATVVSGLEMFIRQAMGQFEHFTGMPAPDSLMRDIVLRKT
ncbi:hypothetical protein ZWY2020_010544 [Hordeum vulgare]|nr:hypothetical protein ZWY2020_010544 [Hordeum vulgare]